MRLPSTIIIALALAGCCGESVWADAPPSLKEGAVIIIRKEVVNSPKCVLVKVESGEFGCGSIYINKILNDKIDDRSLFRIHVTEITVGEKYVFVDGAIEQLSNGARF